MPSFEQQRAFAKEYEKAVAAWCQRRAFRVLATYDFSGEDDNKAPKLMATDDSESLVVPDLLLSRRGECRWVEVKYKTSADWTRLKQRYETGLSRRLWAHYLWVKEDTGIEVSIFFVHKREREMRGGTISQLSALGPREYTGGKMGRAGMIFFPYEQIPRLASLEEIVTDQPEAPGDQLLLSPARI